MLSETWVSFYYVRFPKYRREILRRASNGGHGEGLLLIIIGVIEVIFAFAEIYEFDFVIGQQKEVGWFDVAMADAFALQERASTYQTAVHTYHFWLAPVQSCFLTFTIEHLEIGGFIHEFSNDAYFEGIVACFT